LAQFHDDPDKWLCVVLSMEVRTPACLWTLMLFQGILEGGNRSGISSVERNEEKEKRKKGFSVRNK